MVLARRADHGEELKRWLAGMPADPAVFGAVQPIYTAARCSSTARSTRCRCGWSRSPAPPGSRCRPGGPGTATEAGAGGARGRPATDIVRAARAGRGRDDRGDIERRLARVRPRRNRTASTELRGAAAHWAASCTTGTSPKPRRQLAARCPATPRWRLDSRRGGRRLGLRVWRERPRNLTGWSVDHTLTLEECEAGRPPVGETIGAATPPGAGRPHLQVPARRFRRLW